MSPLKSSPSSPTNETLGLFSGRCGLLLYSAITFSKISSRHADTYMISSSVFVETSCWPEHRYMHCIVVLFRCGILILRFNIDRYFVKYLDIDRYRYTRHCSQTEWCKDPVQHLPIPLPAINRLQKVFTFVLNVVFH